MKVAELFVDILPDMGGFQGTLNKALTTAESKASVEVGVTADVKNLASDISKAAKKAEPEAVKIPVQMDEESSNRAIGVVDTLGARAGIAAGGIGDLAGALEAQGIISEEMAGAMETAAATVQGFAGVADLALISTEGLKAAKTALAAADLRATIQATASTAATKAMTVVTYLQATATKVLNAAMRMNPIGIVITAITALIAIFVTLYNKNEAFRELVQKVWTAIKTAVVDTWNNNIKPALDALWRFIQETLIPLFQKLWDTVKMVFEKIAATVTWLWNTIIKPVFNLWWSYITDVLIPIIMKLWDFIKAAFDKIADIIQWVWENVIKKVFNAIKNIITDVVIPIFQKIWDFVKKAFEGVGNAISWVWENVIKKAFDAIKTGVDLVKTGFQNAVDGIKTIWDGIKKIAAVPVNFVIDTVWNNGLRKALNLIPGVNIAEAKTVSFARGGVLPGYTPGRDVHTFSSPTGGRLRLSGGEAIMRPEWARAVGGARAVDAMNKRAMHGSLHKPQGFFLGGTLPLPGANSISKHGGYGWAQWAGDLNAPNDFGKPIVAWKAGTVASRRSIAGSYGNHIRVNHSGQHSLYAHMSSMVAEAGQRVGAGDMIGRVGSTGNSSGPHLHFEVSGGSVDQSDTGGGEDEGHWWDVIPDTIRKVKAALNSTLGNTLLNIREIGKGIGNTVIDFLNSKIPWPFPDIPHFADGGIVQRPTIGLLGEKGPEAVVPLRRGGTGMNRGPSVMIQNYNVYGDTDVDAFMQKAEFYVRAGRV